MRALRELLPIGLCILACGLVGNGFYSVVKDFKTGIPSGVAIIRIGFIALLVLFAYILYKSRLRRFGAQPMLWCGVFVAAIFAGASADSWQDSLESLAKSPLQSPYHAITYSIGFFLVLAFVRRSYLKIPPRSLINIGEDDPEGRKHLILFLSDITDLQNFPGGRPAWLSGAGRNLDDDLASLAQEKTSSASQNRRPHFWPWEQSLRAISHHLRKQTLKAVTVIASEKSIQQVQIFATVIAAYSVLAPIEFRLWLKINESGTRLVKLDRQAPTMGGWSFENFTELSKAVHALLLLLQENYHDSDLMIDFTGGKKVTSVVAATMTFNREIKAQYVETEYPWNVRSYKLVTAAELGPGT